MHSDPKYSLLQVRGIAISKIIGAFHFITGCDDVSFLRGFTKDFCIKIFDRFNDQICAESAEKTELMLSGDHHETNEFFCRLLICIYCQKFSNCFSPGDLEKLSEESRDRAFDTIRESTWHKTIVLNNQLPTITAISLHCQRIGAVLRLNSSATCIELNKSAYENCGWRPYIIEGKKLLVPMWDTVDNNKRITDSRKIIMKKCGCKKSRCLTKSCSCKRSDGGFCTKLCACNDCANRKNENLQENVVDLDEESEEDVEEDIDDDEVDGIEMDEEVDEDLQEMLQLLSEEEEETEVENFIDHLLG